MTQDTTPRFLIAVHCDSGSGMENRFDTISIPNAGIAVLCRIAQMMNVNSVALDKSFLGTNNSLASDRSGDSFATLKSHVFAAVQASLARKELPFVLCTVLNYNAEESLRLLKQVKDRFGTRVRTGVGGQHIRTCVAGFLTKLSRESAKRSNLPYFEGGYLDHVAVGHAEVLLPKIFGFELNQAAGQDVYVQGELQLEPGSPVHYATPYYDTYHAIRERLDAMAQMPPLGPFGPGGRQLVIEGVRGCSWAYAHKRACTMCALESIDSKPHFKPFDQYFRHLRELVENFGINWAFDVSNQFLPTLSPFHMQKWLASYTAAKKKFGCQDINLYAYLTANSLTPMTVPMLREAGVTIVYVGIDGWGPRTQEALHKARLTMRTDKKRHLQMIADMTESEPQRSLEQVLDLCRKNGLFIRTSLVVGSGLDRDELARLPEFVATIARDFRDVVLTLGIFEQIILPGSPVFTQFERRARENNWEDVIAVYDHFRIRGFLDWAEQENLNQLFLLRDQQSRVAAGSLRKSEAVSPDQVREAIRQAREIAESDGKMIVTDIENGGQWSTRSTPPSSTSLPERGTVIALKR